VDATSSDWTPYQFYSASCQQTYDLDVSPIITRDNEALAICRDDFSDISPLTGGSVAFSTLEGRPSAYDFENSDVLQVRTKEIIIQEIEMTLSYAVNEFCEFEGK